MDAVLMQGRPNGVAKIDNVGRAERRRAAAEAYLQAEFVRAAIEARNLISLGDLEAMVIEASRLNGVLKLDLEPAPEIAWDEGAASSLVVLDQPFMVIWIKVAEFDDAWKASKRYYVKRPNAGLIQAVETAARRGVMLPPPTIVKLSSEWAFLEGRNRYLYTRENGFLTLPVSVPVSDAQELFDLAGFPLSANASEGQNLAPLARAYSDLNEAIDRVGMHLANKFYSSVMAAAMAAAENEAGNISRELSARERRRAAKLELAIDFSEPNSRAMNELRLSALALIREFTLEQRQAVLNVMRESVEQGLNPIDVARRFRATVGLTAAQERYVSNYRRALERAHESAAARANILGRQLHDGRSSRSILRAAATGKPLSQTQIDQMTARYRAAWIKHRAETIGRTEGLKAVHAGEAAAWQGAIDQGHIQAAEVIQTWHTAKDECVRGTHATMQGQERKFGEQFRTGGFASLRFPGDPLGPPHEVINCRCVVTRQITEQPIEAVPSLPDEAAASIVDDVALGVAQGIDDSGAAGGGNAGQ